MIFSYITTFDYKPLALEKVTNNCMQQSIELRNEGVSPFKQNASIGLLASVKKHAKPEDAQILTNEYTDNLGRTRKCAAGLLESRVRPRRGAVYVDSLVANPKGDVEEGFGGATDALVRHLKSNYPDYGVQMHTPQREVSDIYARKLGIPADLTDEGYMHTGMIRDIP